MVPVEEEDKIELTLVKKEKKKKDKIAERKKHNEKVLTSYKLRK
jgi:hypothetical protein